MTHTAPVPERDAESQPSTQAVAPRGPMRPAGITLVVVLVVVVLFLAVGFVGAVVGRSTRPTSPATVTVTGSGTVITVPNTIQFNVGVQTTGPSAASTLAANNRRVMALESVLLANGVTRKDMQTSDLNIWENTNNAGMLTGFTVQDTLNVTMHNFKKAGAAIDAAAKVAGNGITFNGITLSVSNDTTQLQLARARAMHDALAEAKSDAAGGGASVGSIVRITDQQQTPYQPVPIDFAAASLHLSSGVPIQQGTQTVSVQVTVVYALNG